MRAIASLTLAVAACAPAVGGNVSAPAPDHAPWIGRSLQPADVPPVYPAVWRAAANRATCALLAPRSPGAAEGVALAAAVPRAAAFSGGWAVAYDLPDTRSAFGVAGSGSRADEPGTYDRWPYRREWSDGSRAGYGPEGGTGPNTLAYLTIPGQGCLYNVWSRLGRAHLESLLGELRFVEIEP